MPAIRTISIRRAAVAALAGAMILSLLPATAMAIPPGKTPARGAEWKVLNQINQYRVSRGLVPYRMDRQTRFVAQARSKEMRDLNYLSHTSPTGKHASTLLARRGVKYQAGAENIGRISFRNWDAAVQGMMSGWKASSGHNASMLSKNFNYVGIGVARTKNVAWFTTVFLRQRDHTAPRAGMAQAHTGITVAATAAGTRRVTVKWWGRDPRLQSNFAGIKSYTVQHKRVGGKKGWTTVRNGVGNRQLTMTLTKGRHKFRVRAVDRAGNMGRWNRPLTVLVGS